jgi:DNA-binding SARP family transcriptional activator
LTVRTIAARPRLEVRLLGRFEVRTTNGIEVHLTGRHAPSLFALLTITGRPRTREAISADLWPDASASLSGPLRQTLYQIRHALTDAGVDPDDVLESCGEALSIRSESIARLDTARFERCADDPACGAEEAVALYGGDLVEGLGHECFVAERERLADRYEDALAAVATRRLDEGDLHGARRAAEQLVALDALREEAHTVLIAIHGQVGSRSQVVRQYRRLEDVLARELGEAPLPETNAVFRAAMASTVARSYDRVRELQKPGATGLAVVNG